MTNPTNPTIASMLRFASKGPKGLASARESVSEMTATAMRTALKEHGVTRMSKATKAAARDAILALIQTAADEAMAKAVAKTKGSKASKAKKAPKAKAAPKAKRAPKAKPEAPAADAPQELPTRRAILNALKTLNASAMKDVRTMVDPEGLTEKSSVREIRSATAKAIHADITENANADLMPPAVAEQLAKQAKPRKTKKASGPTRTDVALRMLAEGATVAAMAEQIVREFPEAAINSKKGQLVQIRAEVHRTIAALRSGRRSIDGATVNVERDEEGSYRIAS